MTIYELKQRNIANGGHFFDREKMNERGETLKSFRIHVDPSNPEIIVVKNRYNRRYWFTEKTGRIDIRRTVGKA
jgi:hypothetical protein